MSKNVDINLSSLEKLSKNLKSVSGTYTYKMNKVLTDNFIRTNSKYVTLNDFLLACGIHNDDEFKAFPDNKMDDFVRVNTHFSSWKEMLTQASIENAKKQLGF